VSVRVAAIVQARMTSTRLPGKVLLPIGGAPVLAWVTGRAAMARTIDEVVLATSTDESDDVVAAWAGSSGVRVVRGALNDVLDRYRMAAETVPDADVVVRLTADCPLLDPGVVDLTVRALDGGADYASTSLDGRYPRGLDAEAVRRDVLLTAAREFDDGPEREHVTLGVYRRPERFRCVPVVAPAWAQRPHLRLTVDEPDDYTLVTLLVEELGSPGWDAFDTEAALDLLDRRPDLAALNAGVAHRNVR
jgi:spore coat polysaccharide biosynthesis protein SpsF